MKLKHFHRPFKSNATRIYALLVEELSRYGLFLRSHTSLLLFTGVIILTTYGIKLFWFDYSIDTEVAMTDYGYLLHSWITIDRFGLVIIKKILFADMFNPYLANFLTYLTLFFTATLLCYLFARITNAIAKPNKAYLIFTGLFVTSPIIAEMFNFSILSFEISLGMLLIVLSVLLCYMAFEKKITFFLLIAVALAMFSFSIYQALPTFYIASVLCCMSLLVMQRKDSQLTHKYYWSIAGIWLLCFFGAMLLYQLLPYAYLALTGSGDALNGGAYLTSQINWGKLPVADVLGIIKQTLSEIVLGKGYFYSLALLSGILLVTITYISLLAKDKLRGVKKYYLILSLGGLIVAPFLLIFVIGNNGDIRTKMPALQLMTAFLFYFTYSYVRHYGIKFVCLILAAAFIFLQITKTTNLFYVEHMKYEEDVALTQRIIGRLDQLGFNDYGNYKLVILGNHVSQLPMMIRTEAVLGKSFFEWDASTKLGVSHRVGGFMNSQGYIFQKLVHGNQNDERLFSQWQQKHNKVPVWPQAGSIIIDDQDRAVIVNLSKK